MQTDATPDATPDAAWHDAAWHTAAVARVLAGDVDAFGELVALHRDRCIRYARRMLGDQDEAEDVTQDAFVRAYRALSRCENPERFGAWLFSILMNRCRTAAQKRARRDRLFADECDTTELWTEPESDSPHEERRLSLQQIETALQRLSPAQREAFLLKYVEEMSYDEMSALTGTRVSALKMRTSRARETLRAHLAEVYDG